MDQIIKIVISLLVKTIIVLVIVLLSSFGWKPLAKFNKKLTDAEIETSERLEDIVCRLAEDIGIRNYQHYKNLEKSALFITEAFENMGYAVEIMSYEVNGQIFKNIIAETSNKNFSMDTIIIGAHYDSCFNPGADDNATGIAGLIELARLFKDVKLNHNLRFVAFVNEEPPFFQTKSMGSFVYTNRIQSSGEKVKVAVVLEMLGYYSENYFSQKYLPLIGPFYPNKANFVAIVGNFKSRKIAHNLYKAFKDSKRFPVERIILPETIPGISYSDHWSFWRVGIPAVMITDTAYLRNSNYHEKTDLPNTLNFGKMAKVIFGLKDSIVALDQEGNK